MKKRHVNLPYMSPYMSDHWSSALNGQFKTLLAGNQSLSYGISLPEFNCRSSSYIDFFFFKHGKITFQVFSKHAFFKKKIIFILDYIT